MSAQNGSPALPRDVGDLLKQIEHHGTPWRIDGTTETYFVLSAAQLITLFRGMIEEAKPAASFTPQDFALTEADLSAYEARRKARREHIDCSLLAPLNPVLEQRLRQWEQVQGQQPLSDQQKRVGEQLLHELETALVGNAQRVARKTK